MAEEKKGFVLYADYVYTIRKMKKEDAGELFLHILEYVNDKDPETENLIVELTFEPIKQQLKRDLKKYEDKKKKLSEAGKASAESKKKAKELEQNSTSLKNVDTCSTFSTVKDTVIVTVNDTVTDNDILLEKETKEKFKEIFISKNEIFGKELLEGQVWVETVSMQNKITPEEVPKWIDDFNKKLITETDTKISKKDYASHFSRWLPGEILKSKKETQPNSGKPKFSINQ